MTQPDVNVSVTTEDIQAVMQRNALFTLQVQNQALQRMVTESMEQVNRLKEELDQSKNGKSDWGHTGGSPSKKGVK